MIRVLLVMANILFFGNCIFSQRSLQEAENYYLLDLLSSADQNNILEIVERDHNEVILRKWMFNVSGKLSEEIDFRESTVTSSINGIENMVAGTKMSTHSYSYDSIGRKLKITKKVYTDTDTIRIDSHFRYIGRDTIYETLNLSEQLIYGELESEYSIGLTICSLRIDNRVDSLSSRWFYNGASSGVENVKYNDSNSGKLAKKEYTYEFEAEEPDKIETKEKKSRKTYFDYDDKDRLCRIKRYDQGKLISENYLFYDSEDSKLQRIESKYDESREPQEITIELFCNRKGLLNKVISNNREYNYEIVMVEK